MLGYGELIRSSQTVGILSSQIPVLITIAQSLNGFNLSQTDNSMTKIRATKNKFVGNEPTSRAKPIADWNRKNKIYKITYKIRLTSLASFIKATKVCSSNSRSFEMRSLAAPSRISSDLSRPAPTAASQQHIKTFKVSPAYTKSQTNPTLFQNTIPNSTKHKLETLYISSIMLKINRRIKTISQF